MSRIEWTDVTWNPVRGCSRMSAGCVNCYAERIAVRFSHKGAPYEGFADVPRRHSQTGRATCGVRGHWTGRVELIAEKLDEPLHWRKPRRVFVNSMSDLFHEALSDDAIADVFTIMAAARQHTFQVLTKRPMRMLAWTHSADKYMRQGGILPAPNIWLGVSVEDQATADERIPLLLQTPAAVRFVSYEPALGPIILANYKDWLRAGLDWLIVGGESGPGARPCDVAWVRHVVRQCREAGVPCFVKQLGARPVTDHRTRPPGESHHWTSVLGDPKGGDPAEWPEDLRVREFPA